MCCIRRDEPDIKFKYNIDIETNDLITNIYFLKYEIYINKKGAINYIVYNRKGGALNYIIYNTYKKVPVKY